MQYHSGAYILALQNYFKDSSKNSFDVRLKTPKSNRYHVRIISDYGSSMKMEISGHWSCQCTAYISHRDRDVQQIELRHSDTSKSIDEFKMDDKSVRNGVFHSENGSNYPFRGYFYGPTQLEVHTINKQRHPVKCDFELC